MRLALSCGFLRPAKTCRATPPRVSYPARQSAANTGHGRHCDSASARTILVPGMYFFGLRRYSKRCSSPHTMPAATRDIPAQFSVLHVEPRGMRSEASGAPEFLLAAV